MNTDKELADKVVALLPEIMVHRDGMYRVLPSQFYFPAESFIRDWRVAGALIEKCKVVSWTKTTTGGSYVHARAKQHGYGEQPKGQVVRAIIEACVEALT